MMLRFKNEEGKINILHTLNGSGLALPRVVAAIIENYQDQEGRVKVPDALKPYIDAEYL